MHSSIIFLCFPKTPFIKDDELTKVTVPAIYNVIQSGARTIDDISKKLNITKICAQDMIKDLNTMSIVENTKNKQEKLDILKLRIKEKLGTSLISLNNNLPLNIEQKKQEKNMRKESINAFINKTGFKDILWQDFSDEIKNLQ